MLSTLRTSQGNVLSSTDLLDLIRDGSVSTSRTALEQQTIHRLLNLSMKSDFTSKEKEFIESVLGTKIRRFFHKRAKKSVLITRLEKLQWEDVETIRALCKNSRTNRWLQKWCKERVRVRPCGNFLIELLVLV